MALVLPPVTRPTNQLGSNMAKKKVKGVEVRKIQDVPVGEFVRLNTLTKKERFFATEASVQRGYGFTTKTYKNEGWDRGEREYLLADQDDISRCRWAQKDTLVQVGFTY
jgi:hypothetical protein